MGVILYINVNMEKNLKTPPMGGALVSGLYNTWLITRYVTADRCVTADRFVTTRCLGNDREVSEIAYSFVFLTF